MDGRAAFSNSLVPVVAVEAVEAVAVVGRVAVEAWRCRLRLPFSLQPLESAPL